MAVELPSSETDVQALLTSAIRSRAAHIRSEAQTITMANVRRLLESDLGLEKLSLDAHKSFIRQLVDNVLLSSDTADDQGEENQGEEIQGGENHGEESQGEEEEHKSMSDLDKARKEASGSKRSKKKKAREELEEVKFEDSHVQDLDIEVPKKKKQKKEKQEKAKKEKKEKLCSTEADEDGGSHDEMSEEGSDAVEAKKPKKVIPKIAKDKSAQDQNIEHLKRTIKACGLTIPPVMYKKAKQLSDDKQDAFLVKELEGILSRNGLSSNPTEKEIKAAKKKIAREKDMEGIDMTNIIMEPRGRRATSQLFPPVYKPPPPAEYDSEDDGDENADDGAEASEDDESNSAAEEEAAADESD